MRKSVIRFALCVTDKEPDLEPGKLYLVLSDERASQEGYLRVIDESGEDYLYPEDYFRLRSTSQESQRSPVSPATG